MARYMLLLLLAVWVLTGELWPGAEARAAPYRVKLCGREFIRAVIFTCGGSRWRRSDILAQEAMEKNIEAPRSKFTCSRLERLDSCSVSPAPKCTRSSINKERYLPGCRC
ncbi:LOW QUALITY PROTEIN: RLN3 isoform 2 [Pongo abelii]|uniref:RLN3 isoform 2 n=1 Tax=Pongo abelii TaxID=9601 RepID=H2NXS1_PONAB|nr:LOW QUALITY PROTEIN: RLN3 isoform 2 [Pongo abelii]